MQPNINGESNSTRMVKKTVIGITVLSALMSTSVSAEVDARSLCRETALLYAHYADTNQQANFNALFTHDGTLATSSGSRKPAQQTVDPSRPARTSRHVATNHIVHEQNGQLTGTSYFTYYASPQSKDGPLPITDQPAAVGVYHDKYVITAGVCKFTAREAKVTFAGE